MATLEIHQPGGRVDLLVLTRERPILFGSDPKCDIVLRDPAAKPVHGRIGWRRGRYRVETLPDAAPVEKNGKKVLKSALDQGDEISLGSARIFLTQVDAPAADAPTRIQPPPLAMAADPKGDPRPVLKRTRPAAPPSRPGFDPPSMESVVGPLGQSQETIQAIAPIGAARPSKAAEPKPRGGWLGRVAAGDAPPGQERILRSPLMIALAVALVALVALGFGLYGIIHRMAADRSYAAAIDSYEQADDRTAIARFDQFLKSHPDDRRAGKARVLKGLAGVRQFTTGAAPSWSNALEAAQSAVEATSGEPTFEDEAPELADLVRRTAEGLAARARSGGEAEALAGAEAAVALHDQIGGPAAKDVRARTRLPGLLVEARAAVAKARTRTRAIAAMDVALKARSPAAAYKARDDLVAEYADLAADRNVLDRLLAANDLIRDAVTFEPTRGPAAVGPLPSRLGPPLSHVLRSRTDRPATGGGAAVFAMAEGFAYGIDGATGAPLWHVPVGASAPFAPRPIPGDEGSALVFDARSNELVRLDARTGAIAWRQPIGGPVADPPLVMGALAYQSTPAGKLLVIELATGELRGTLELGRPLARTPVADESGRWIYALGEEANLFVIDRESMACRAVEYIGHAPGSIGAAPLRLGRYLILAENHRPAAGRLLVYLIAEDGPKLRRRQEIELTGWLWDAPATAGSTLWAAGDEGGLSVFAIGPYDATDPLRPLAKLANESQSLGPTFLSLRSEREGIVASGRSARVDLDAERGTLAARWTLGQAGPALAAPQAAGRLTVLTQQSDQGGGVALWGIDPTGGSVAWRTDLGVAWRSPPSATVDGGLATLGARGDDLRIPADRLAEGGFVEQPLPRPGDTLAIGPGLDRIEGGGRVILAPPDGSPFVWTRPAAGGELTRLTLPSPLAARPAFLGEDLFVPAADGRAYLVDPTNGAPRAEPLVLPYDRDRVGRWRSPAVLDDSTLFLVDGGTIVRRVERTTVDGRPRLVTTAEATLDSRAIADPALVAGALVLATADGKVRTLSARDLSPVATIPLDAPLAAGPSTVGPLAVVSDRSGALLAFAADGSRAWTSTLGSGLPVASDEGLWTIEGDRLVALDPIVGTPRGSIPIGQSAAGPPVPLAPGRFAVPLAPGTLSLLPDVHPSADGEPVEPAAQPD